MNNYIVTITYPDEPKRQASEVRFFLQSLLSYIDNEHQLSYW